MANMKTSIVLASLLFSIAASAQTAALSSKSNDKPAAKADAKPATKTATMNAAPAVYPMQEGFVDSGGILIYYKTLGVGKPLMIVHGGPGASHDYFLPYLLPLARHHKLIFIDERGSGRSTKAKDVKDYTVENMVEDVEAVRQGLKLGKIDLLGHSYGGVLAQAYAFKYQQNLNHLMLCSTFHSTKALNAIFVKMLNNMTPELRERIKKMEKEGLYGHGKDYEKNRYTSDYMVAAWGEGYFPYLYQNHPDANYDPTNFSGNAWDLYREMWGSNGEYIIDGNLVSVEYADRLPKIKVPTLITVGDHDESDPSIAREINRLIPGSKLVILPKSGHMTFVDQPEMYLDAINEFLKK